MEIKNSLLIKSAFCQKVPRPPVWLMRQAGRYLKSYRDIRRKYSFQSMYTTPELAAEITLQPIRTFWMDAAIIFSDLLVTAEALGMKLDYFEGKGPVFRSPIRNPKDVERLRVDGAGERLDFVYQAIRLAKRELELMGCPLIGFAGAPFTVASYMIEGSGTKNFLATRKAMYSDPKSFHKLLSKITAVTKSYIRGQIHAGADVIQIFDSWADILNPEKFREFCLPYLKDLIGEVKKAKHVPVILFCKGSTAFAPLMAGLAPHVISLDAQCSLPDMRRSISKTIALQGNLDPSLLYAPLSVIRKTTLKLLDDMRGKKGFIVNLGHGLLPDVPEDAVRCIVETVKEYK